MVHEWATVREQLGVDLGSEATVAGQIGTLICSFVGWRSIIVRFIQKMDRNMCFWRRLGESTCVLSL